jgi:hypothetical protein
MPRPIVFDDEMHRILRERTRLSREKKRKEKELKAQKGDA